MRASVRAAVPRPGSPRSDRRAATRAHVRPGARPATRATGGRWAPPEEVRLDDRKPHFNALLDGALTGVDRDPIRRLLGRDARCRKFLDLPGGYGLLNPSLGPRAGVELFRVAALECWLRQIEGVQALGSSGVR